jgi:hypothetical protein
MGDRSGRAQLSSTWPEVFGRGGGCIELGSCVGDSGMDSSMAGKFPGASAIGESRLPLLTYFGVSASEEPGGDMYCSTPTSIGKVWLRGR